MFNETPKAPAQAIRGGIVLPGRAGDLNGKWSHSNPTFGAISFCFGPGEGRKAALERGKGQSTPPAPRARLPMAQHPSLGALQLLTARARARVDIIQFIVPKGVIVPRALQVHWPLVVLIAPALSLQTSRESCVSWPQRGQGGHQS